MTEFLVRHFVKDYEHTEKVAVRTAYGVLASVVGIICNVLLFVVKFVIGFLVHSVSVMADAFNNLSDAGSSIISFVGVKIASKPADEEHPFGHGRMEYISALVVSFLVLEVGFTFLKDSFGKIKSPEVMNFQMISVIILVLSIGVKLWLGLFNQKLGKRIDSKVMMAVFTDSMGDVLTTSVTILSLLVFHFTGYNIDGFVGIGVALVVMWAGVGIAKDTLEPLLGEAVNPEVFQKIKAFVESYDGVVGSHDLIVHNYGPNRSMASIHAEVPNNVSIEASHEVIDRIERDAMENLGIFLVVHMDPIEIEDEHVVKIRNSASSLIAQIDENCSIHDFRVVDGQHQINLIFDLVVPREYSKEKQKAVEQQLCQELKEQDPRYEFVITLEHSFISEAE